MFKVVQFQKIEKIINVIHKFHNSQILIHVILISIIAIKIVISTYLIETNSHQI